MDQAEAWGGLFGFAWVRIGRANAFLNEPESGVTSGYENYQASTRAGRSVHHNPGSGAYG
jgi:hypothetical protein